MVVRSFSRLKDILMKKLIENVFPINNPFRSSRAVQKALKIINKKVVKKD
ncbi:hypothetical protein AGMMS5026_10840 [Endomicrobiia bacterium]|nr:hypothetical protein AGMMS49571_10990 [Endomicrobiia bacterium]GHT21760.1 hypothetical protein AGMMS49929_10690 [Endomicrobiia bacterium]GHT32597.1 hypothetical protein AGMMS5026_10840 [Endomicrobiia bacterium]